MLTQIKNLQWATKAVKNAIFKRLFYFKSFVWEGEGGSLYKKDESACQKFKKEPLRGTKNLFCRCGLKCFFFYP